jgi:hypothetical protein
MYNTCTLEKKFQKICATFVIFKKHPKVNSHTIGEHSPNLVTLSTVQGHFVARLNVARLNVDFIISDPMSPD